jgi:hypothetical protein
MNGPNAAPPADRAPRSTYPSHQSRRIRRVQVPEPELHAADPPKDTDQSQNSANRPGPARKIEEHRHRFSREPSPGAENQQQCGHARHEKHNEPGDPEPVTHPKAAASLINHATLPPPRTHDPNDYAAHHRSTHRQGRDEEEDEQASVCRKKRRFYGQVQVPNVPSTDDLPVSPRGVALRDGETESHDDGRERSTSRRPASWPVRSRSAHGAQPAMDHMHVNDHLLGEVRSGETRNPTDSVRPLD